MISRLRSTLIEARTHKRMGNSSTHTRVKPVHLRHKHGERERDIVPFHGTTRDARDTHNRHPMRHAWPTHADAASRLNRDNGEAKVVWNSSNFACQAQQSPPRSPTSSLVPFWLEARALVLNTCSSL